MKFKIRLDWKKAAIFLSVSAGLLYLTHSALMSIGIMMLLFVVDALIVNYEYRQQTRRFFEELRRENTDEATNEDENEQR
jgi:hypothetical protein